MAEKIKLFNVDNGYPKEVRTLPELLNMLGSGRWSVDPLPPKQQEKQQPADSKDGKGK